MPFVKAWIGKNPAYADLLKAEERFAMAAVRDNKALGRFELDVEGAMAFANYRLTPRPS